jgi:hypothetical protein
MEAHDIKAHTMRKIFRKELNLRYKRCSKTSTDWNQPRLKAIRSVFSEKLLGLMNQNKRILNIDETSMTTTTYSHYSWGSKGKTLRITSKPISPRATVLAGVDNLGNLYASVFLCNGNRQIF